ncbi:PAX3- and PAX7-binding protein 1 [Sitodiplosis mosellana]|uniref:PAX3- and PAX7-binding protein 1 n=1 Tax=Sitodiplosis mosellana TaxID=263140 RepID=UPI002444DD7E|nr:PAX3- and PAX7-binding protein 1 [Sitodiplosis mosellana]
MSLFRRPKKAAVHRRVFSAVDDDESTENSGKNCVEDELCRSIKTPSLLSFGDEEDEAEVFQIKKSSQSKKVMKMLDKERRKKKSKEKDQSNAIVQDSSMSEGKSNNGFNNETNPYDVVCPASFGKNSSDQAKSSHVSKHTEIRTDDFVLVVKKTETEPSLVLNGRAALCAGRDDMSSSEDESVTKEQHQHRFTKPDNFKALLESGAIPDAHMIHEARKKRQLARELGDFIPIEDNEQVDNKKGRLIREEAEDDVSDEERVNMSAITGQKELDERREKFYSVQGHGSDEDSDLDIHEWESQQIRKAISGSQLINAQQEAFSHFLIRDGSNDSLSSAQISTGNLLKLAYASSNIHKSPSTKLNQIKTGKKTGPKMPHEVLDIVKERLNQVEESKSEHLSQIQKINNDLNVLTLEELNLEQNAPVVASKFLFYQELKGYIYDLIECFDTKVPQINELERKYMAAEVKYAHFLIERRRQDVRDQARDCVASQKSVHIASSFRKEEEQQIQRAAEREGRRTRRRRDRERRCTTNDHLDGMSSDDEIPDQESTTYKNQIKQINAEALLVFEDCADEFSDLSSILGHFEAWRNHDIDSYKETYFSLCLPKIIGPILRLNLLTWNPLNNDCKDLEKMKWFEIIMRYGFIPSETEIRLFDDPDIRLVPTLMEKIVLPKITEFIEKAWDPLSSTQTLRLVTLIKRMIARYPTLKSTSKYMRNLITTILNAMRLSLEYDVFIPIFPKQLQDAKSSFFQRQFSSALKLFRNLLSWEGIISDSPLKEIAISSLLNRYLLSAIRICTLMDAVNKSYIIINTLPCVWLQQSSILQSLDLFIQFLRSLITKIDVDSDAGRKIRLIFEILRLPLNTSIC